MGNRGGVQGRRRGWGWRLGVHERARKDGIDGDIDALIFC